MARDGAEFLWCGLSRYSAAFVHLKFAFLSLCFSFMSHGGVDGVYRDAIDSFVGSFVCRVIIITVTICFFCGSSLKLVLLVYVNSALYWFCWQFCVWSFS